MEERESHATGLGFAFGLLVGVLAGAATAILLAPRPGVETREILVSRAQDLKEKATGIAHDVKEGIGSRVGARKESKPVEGGLSSEGVTVL